MFHRNSSWLKKSYPHIQHCEKLDLPVERSFVLCVNLCTFTESLSTRLANEKGGTEKDRKEMLTQIRDGEGKLWGREKVASQGKQDHKSVKNIYWVNHFIPTYMSYCGLF